MLEALQRVTDAALAYLPADELLTELLERITEILHVDTAAILLLEPSGEMLRARAAKGIEEEVEQGVRIPVGRGFAGRVAATRTAVTIEDVDHADILNPILREKGIRSLLGVPLLVTGRVLGVLHVGSLTPRDFTADDRELLQLAADRAAIAIEHAQLFEERRIAETLQRHLLPQELPAIAGLELACRYLPAGGTSLGGDWYDVFELPGGRVALAVGDVVGHGVVAAAVMAQLRTALRAYAAEGHPPALVVESVNRLMWQPRPDRDDDARLRGARPRRGGARAGHRRTPAGAARLRRRRGALPAVAGRDGARRVADLDVPLADRPLPGRQHARALHRRARRAPRRVDRRRARAPARDRRADRRRREPVHAAARRPWSGTSRRTTSPSSPPGCRR